jgi:hypothetical protein
MTLAVKLFDDATHNDHNPHSDHDLSTTTENLIREQGWQ